MVTNYQRGTEIERKLKKMLEDNKWIVARTAASKSPCDLIAVKGRDVRFIQLKRIRRGSFSKNAYLKILNEEMKDIPTGTVEVKKEVWVWKDRVGWLEFD